MVTEHDKISAQKHAPSRSSLRTLLLQIAINDSDLRMLCIDHLPDMMQYFSSGMSYDAMLNAILERVPPASLLLAIEACQAMAPRLARYRDLLAATAPQQLPAAATRARSCRVAVPPARSAYSMDWYVDRPEEEAQALDALEYPGAAVVFNAPSGLGKTWLLQHLLQQFHSRGRLVNLDLRAFGTDEIMASYSSFLRELARQIIVDACISDPEQATALVATAWRCSTNPIHNINTLMKQQILSCMSEGHWLILSLDGVDALSAHPYAEDFFTLLRSWMDSAARQPWSALRLVIALAMAPRLIISCVHQSPFNVATQIYVADLVDWQVDRLAAQYALRWDPEERQALMGTIGGHPYLLRLAMHEARRTGRTVTELISAHSQIFADHLSQQQRWLRAAPALQTAFTRALQDGRAPIDFDSFDRLRHAGFLLRDDSGALRPRYPLYGRLVGFGT